MSSKLQDLYKEYFTASKVFKEIGYLPFLYMRVSGKRVPSKIQEGIFIDSIKNNIRKLNIDKVRFNRLFSTYVNALKSGRKTTGTLESFILKYIEQLEGQIESEPNSLNKAYSYLKSIIDTDDFYDWPQAYDVLVFLRDYVSSDTRDSIISDWKREISDNKKWHKDSFYKSNIFWSSRGDHEALDGISRYRFREFFSIGEFESIFTEVEDLLQTSINLELNPRGYIAWHLWLMSRSKWLPIKLKDSISIALKGVSINQDKQGWWKDENQWTRGEIIPSAFHTALFSSCLQNLGNSSKYIDQSEMGTKWLVENQNPEGFWGEIITKKSGYSENQDVFTTVLCLNLIRNHGIENVEHTLKLGESWLLGKQDRFGIWESKTEPHPLLTVLVLEYFKRVVAEPFELDNFSRMSAGFLRISKELSMGKEVNSNRLSIISAFHGIEFFLYSVLSHPKVGIEIYTGKRKTQTIGFRIALEKLQTFLQNSGDIDANKSVKYKNILDELAMIRDNVVHKGLEINSSQCTNLIIGADSFISFYSQHFFGRDILA